MSHNIPIHFGSAPAQHETDSNNSAANGTAAQSSQMATGHNGTQPGIDLSALQGISPQQLALIAHLMQTGQIPLPPPAPTPATGLPSSSQPQPSPNSQSLAAASTQMHGGADVDMDKEEGELEEGEVGESPASREFLRTPPKGPRIPGRSPRSQGTSVQDLKHRSQQSPRTLAPPSQNLPRRPSGLNNVTVASQVNGDHTPREQLSRDASIKSFIYELHQAGFGFEQVAREVTDPASLRCLYQQYGVPLTAPMDSTSTIDTANSAQPGMESQRKVSAPKKSASAKQPAVQDRSAYLAKLQAAKNKKSEPPAVKQSGDITQQDKPSESSTPSRDSPATKKISATGSDKSKGRIKVDNELVRQRLEAFRAQQAAKQNAAKVSSDHAKSSSPGSASISSAQQSLLKAAAKPALGDGLVEAAKRATAEASALPARIDTDDPARSESQEGSRSITDFPRATRTDIPTSASPTLNRGFGLPGLFTTLSAATGGHQQSESSRSTPLSGMPSTVVQQPSRTSSRPHIYYPAPGPAYPASLYSQTHAMRSQSYGTASHSWQDQYDDSSEPFIIENTDGEESGEEGSNEMEIDDSEQEEQNASSIQPGNASVAPDGRATAATPSVITTPAKRSLDGMNYEEMKRRIALHEERRRKGGADELKSAQQNIEKSVATAGLSSTSSGQVTPIAEPMILRTDQASSEHGGSTLSTSQKQDLRMRLAAAERELAARKGGSSALTGINALAPAAGPSDNPEVSNHAAEPKTASLETIERYETEMGEVQEGDLSDEDDALYAGPNDTESSNNGVPVQGGAGSQEPPLPQSQQTAREERSSGSLPFQQLGVSDDVGHSRASDPSDDDEAMYQTANEDNLRSALRPESPRNNPVIRESMDQDDEDDLDDIYGVDETPEHQDAEVTTVPMEISDIGENQSESESEDDDSDDNEEDEEGDDGDVESDDSMDTSADGEASPELRPQQVLAQVSASESSAGYSRQSSSERGDDTDGSIALQMPPINDDLAPELQPPHQEAVAPPEQETRKIQTFTPYVSPLAKFKDYRYHSNYLSAVSGGYKSLTYSNKIDSELALCPWEVVEGSCYNNCDRQHFRSMEMSDNDLLRAMGTEKIPARTPDEEQRWKHGLNAVVQELRTTNQGKDALAIAKRIAEYRREFRGDPTKTLILD